MKMIHWTEQEFDALAQALRQQFPERAAAQAVTPQQFVFTTHEVGAVMRSIFPRERQRALNKGMGRRLATRLIQLGGDGPAPLGQRSAQASKHVHWTPAEWRYYALSLMTLFPQLNLLNSPDLAELRLSHLNKACAMMEPGRQRSFHALGGPIVRLLAIYNEAKKTGDPMFTGVRPAAAPAEPPAAKPAAPVKLHQVPTGQSGATCKVFWTKAEWVKVAAELHRQYPHAKYPERNNLGALNSTDVYGAQTVLPEERRRKNLKHVAMSMLRGPLLEAFKTVRAMQTEEQQLKMAEAQQAHSDLLARAAEIAAVPNQWETAFKPFVDLLVREIGAQLLPALLDGLRQGLVAERPTPPAHLSLAAPPASRRAVMRIAVVGNENKNSYGAELDRHFPNVDFVYLDNHFEAARNCDKVIGLVRFISHSTEGAVKKLAGDRYVRVNGGISDLKRVVGSWLAESAKVANAAAVA